MYTEDFRRLMSQLGVADVRTMVATPIGITDPEIDRKVGHVRFRSITIRAFKLPLEDRCEDYGQSVEYRGTIPEFPAAFVLDDHHTFETGKLVPVCGNTAAMVMQTRFKPHFRIHGEGAVHYGLFACGAAPAEAPGKTNGACC